MFIFKNNFKAEKFFANAEHPLAKIYLEELDENYREFKGTPIESLKFSLFKLFEETGNREEYQGVYYKQRRRLLTFILKVWLKSKQEDIYELEDILWAICDEYSWAIPAHLNVSDRKKRPYVVDLFAAETAQAISEVLSLCGHVLQEQVKERCIEEVFRRVIVPFENNHFWWEEGYSNWSAVCGGAVGMAALYLIEDEKRLRKITDRAISSCNYFLASCTDDGVCLEGIAYWEYAMSLYVSFAELYKQRMNKDIMADNEKLKKLSEFPNVSCLGNNIVIRFSDCGNHMNMPFGIVCRLAEIFDVRIPEMSYFTKLLTSTARCCSAVRSFEWFNPELLSYSAKEENVFFPEAEWAIKRRGNHTLVIKGGHNDEPHNHNDIGSYMFIKGDNILIDELGCPLYTKLYFSEHRYEYINSRSFGHSVPVINSCEQCPGQVHTSEGFFDEDDSIRISFAEAYDRKSAGIKKAIRTAKLSEKGLLIKDEFEFIGNPNTISERIITHFDVKKNDENSVSIINDGIVIGNVEFFNDGKITLLQDEYNSPGRNSKVQKFNIIDFEICCNLNKCEIRYFVK